MNARLVSYSNAAVKDRDDLEPAILRHHTGGRDGPNRGDHRHLIAEERVEILCQLPSDRYREDGRALPPLH